MPSSPPQSPRYRLRPGTLSSDLGGELVILDSQGGDYFALNEVGACIWEFLEDEGSNVPPMIEKVCAKFAVDRSVAERDVMLFLNDLVDRGLLGVHASN